MLPIEGWTQIVNTTLTTKENFPYGFEIKVSSFFGDDEVHPIFLHKDKQSIWYFDKNIILTKVPNGG